MRLAFIGLGVMGFPMAGHLAKVGHEVTVYNRSPAKAEAWVGQHGGNAAATPASASAECDAVFACVGNDDDVREVTIGVDGAFSAMKPDAIFVDHTTASATLARELGETAQNLGLYFIDAPVSGGQSGAEAGTLSIMSGGDEQAFATIEPVMRAYGKTIARMGENGAGQLAKMVNQICIAGIIQGLAEGLEFSKRAGLDGEALLGVIGAGAAGSWQMHNRGATMLQDRFDFGFAVDWMIKDLGICLDEAANNGAALPVTSKILDYFREASKNGDGRMDTSCLIRRLYKQ
jgi:3-hydroxyisobutyrate dehydrogenase-like beta-hydroxyacid dehydrogenase